MWCVMEENGEAKGKGGIGLRDPGLLNNVTSFKRKARLWTFDASIWIKWVRLRYIKNQELASITQGIGDSQAWKNILAV